MYSVIKCKTLILILFDSYRSVYGLWILSFMKVLLESCIIFVLFLLKIISGFLHSVLHKITACRASSFSIAPPSSEDMPFESRSVYRLSCTGALGFLGFARRMPRISYWLAFYLLCPHSLRLIYIYIYIFVCVCAHTHTGVRFFRGLLSWLNHLSPFLNIFVPFYIPSNIYLFDSHSHLTNYPPYAA